MLLIRLPLTFTLLGATCLLMFKSWFTDCADAFSEFREFSNAIDSEISVSLSWIGFKISILVLLGHVKLSLRSLFPSPSHSRE